LQSSCRVVTDATTALLLRRGPYETKKTWAPRLVVLTGPTCHGDI
jgi:hypothetical protein